MKILGWLTLAAVGLLTVFAAANWSALIAPTSLNFLAFTVEGPLGLILLGGALIVVALFSIYAVSLRTSTLLEYHRHARELDAQRDLANKAEASRYTALGTHLDERFAQLQRGTDDARTVLLQRADTLEHALLKALDETTNSLSACVGEVDEKVNRYAPPHR